MVLSEAIRDYVEYSRHELRHSKNTSYAYVSWQRNFAQWLTENGHPDPLVHEISASLIRRYHYHLSGRKLRPRTIRGALQALRSLFTYLVEMGALATNPAVEVKLPKKDAATRLLVTDEDLMRLLEASQRQPSEFRCVRDRAILAILIFCGVRRQELVDLTVPSINLTDRSLLIQHGKGEKSRTVFLCDEAVEPIREWLAMRQKYQCSHDRVFITVDRRPFGDKSLAPMVEDVKTIAGLRGDPRIKPHSIRHAAATRLLRNGADIRSIQTWLGHSQLQTTAIYLHTDEHQVRKIAPLAGFQQTQTPDGVEAASEDDQQKQERSTFYRKRRAGR